MKIAIGLVVLAVIVGIVAFAMFGSGKPKVSTATPDALADKVSTKLGSIGLPTLGDTINGAIADGAYLPGGGK